jgi:hypothetical protein
MYYTGWEILNNVVHAVGANFVCVYESTTTIIIAITTHYIRVPCTLCGHIGFL